jgi:hypothetical protein
MLALMTQIAMSGEAQVVDGGANLRSGPGLEYRVIFGVSAGKVVKFRDCPGNGSWCRVSVYGRRGWIAASRLALPYAGRPGDDTAVTDGSVGSDGNPTGVGADGESNEYVKILGIVVDKPGYCYALDYSGNSIIVKCP